MKRRKPKLNPDRILLLVVATAIYAAGDHLVDDKCNLYADGRELICRSAGFWSIDHLNNATINFQPILLNVTKM